MRVAAGTPTSHVAAGVRDGTDPPPRNRSTAVRSSLMSARTGEKTHGGANLLLPLFGRGSKWGKKRRRESPGHGRSMARWRMHVDAAALEGELAANDRGKEEMILGLGFRRRRPLIYPAKSTRSRWIARTAEIEAGSTAAPRWAEIAAQAQRSEPSRAKRAENEAERAENEAERAEPRNARARCWAAARFGPYGRPE
nr:unnamed protein product [Digitaria exilis]